LSIRAKTHENYFSEPIEIKKTVGFSLREKDRIGYLILRGIREIFVHSPAPKFRLISRLG
jgi:hypothetical protein